MRTPKGGRAPCSTLGAAMLGLLAACATSPRPASHEHDREAAIYNTQLGIGYLQQGDLALAKEKLDRALQQNPKDPNVHSARALFFSRTQASAKADEEYRMALRLAPRDPELLNNYAAFLCQSGHPDEAVRRFDEAARNPLYKTPEYAYANAGVCQRSVKRIDAARASFLRALQVRPNYSEAAFQLADLEFQAQHLTEARAEIETFLQSFEATPDLLLVAVRVARAQGDQVAAERYARRLRLDFPGSDQARALSTLGRNPG